MHDDLAYLGIADLAKRYRRREISPVEVTRAALDRIGQMESKLNAYTLVTAERALEDAKKAENRIADGDAPLLCGIPFSMKDIFDVEGLPLTCASNVLRGYVSTRTAFVAERLFAAGAVFVGKNNLLEFAYAETHPDFGPTPNPWNLERSTAGSSSGSAASVAAGQVYFSIGTDTGGSVRLPASFCGLVGIKPTYGLVSRSGLVSLSWSCDNAGPLTRTVEDAAIVLQVMAGHDPSDPTSADRPPADFVGAIGRPVRGLRAGLVAREFEEHVHPDVRRAALEAVQVLRSLGVEVVEVTTPPFEQAVTALLTVVLVDAAAFHQPWMEERPDGYSPGLLERRLKLGRLIPAVDYVHAQRFRREFQDGIARVLHDVDLLLTPTSPFPAHALTEEVPGRDFTPLVRKTAPFNLSGFPALSVSCGFSADGLPIGLQLIGRAFAEDTLLLVAHAYEQATEWHTRRPPAI